MEWTEGQLEWIEANSQLIEQWPVSYPQLHKKIIATNKLSFFDTEVILFMAHYAKFGKEGFIIKDHSQEKNEFDIILTSTVPIQMPEALPDYPFVISTIVRVPADQEFTYTTETRVRRRLAGILIDYFKMSEEVAQDIASCKFDNGLAGKVVFGK